MKSVSAFALAATLLVTFGHADAVAMYSSAVHVRVGSKVVKAGDSALAIKGDPMPDRQKDLINLYGVKLGEEWMYDRGNGSWTVVQVDNNSMITAVLDMIDR